MIRVRAIPVVLLSLGFVTAPAGWREDVEQAKTLAAKVDGVAHFGGAPKVTTTKVFLAPDGPGALYITVVVGKVTDHRDEAARVEIDSFLAVAQRAKLSSSKVSTGRTESIADTQRKELVVTLQWSDQETKAETHARLVVAGDAESLIAVTGECMFGEATTAGSRAACSKALDTLDPAIAADKRVALALAADGAEPPPRPDPVPAPRARPQATMTDGTRAPLPPITLPTETKRTTDRRPVYVGLGIVALAAVSWWNRRRRARGGAGRIHSGRRARGGAGRIHSGRRDREGAKEPSDDDER